MGNRTRAPGRQRTRDERPRSETTSPRAAPIAERQGEASGGARAPNLLSAATNREQAPTKTPHSPSGKRKIVIARLFLNIYPAAFNYLPCRWECAGIQYDYTHQAQLVWRVISLNPVAVKQCPNLSSLLQVPDIADSHHLDGIGYIRHPASGGFVCFRVPDGRRSSHIAPVIARESGRSAARVGLDPKFGTIVIPFQLPIGLTLHPSPPGSCSYHPLWRYTRISLHERRSMSGVPDR